MSDIVVFGIDFTSAPGARKPIRVAAGLRHGAVMRLTGLTALVSLDDFSAWLTRPGPWVAGFDLPFGLPRELVEHLGWPTDYAALMAHYAALSRAEIRDRFAAFCDARPAGSKFAHRACDGPAGSSPSMKWVNPPVAWMLHAGVPRLIAAGVHLPQAATLATGPDVAVGVFEHQRRQVVGEPRMGKQQPFEIRRRLDGTAGRGRPEHAQVERNERRQIAALDRPHPPPRRRGPGRGRRALS